MRAEVGAPASGAASRRMTARIDTGPVGMWNARPVSVPGAASSEKWTGDGPEETAGGPVGGNRACRTVYNASWSHLRTAALPLRSRMCAAGLCPCPLARMRDGRTSVPGARQCLAHGDVVRRSPMRSKRLPSCAFGDSVPSLQPTPQPTLSRRVEWVPGRSLRASAGCGPACRSAESLPIHTPLHRGRRPSVWPGLTRAPRTSIN